MTRRVIEERQAKLNVSLELIKNNISTNLQYGHEEVDPYSTVSSSDGLQPRVSLLGGGPSLVDYREQLARRNYYPVATVNGTLAWALDEGLHPRYQVMVDARPENVRFLTTPVLGCTYLLASQVHPSVFKKAPKKQIRMWHNAVNDEIVEYICDARSEAIAYKNVPAFVMVKGGPTVVSRAISIFGSMGYSVDVYGMDCSYRDSSHAYPQDAEGEPFFVEVLGKKFKTNAWMVAQLVDFSTQMRKMPGVQVRLHGDGLLGHTIRALNVLPNVSTD